MVRLCGLPRRGRRLGGAFSRTGIANADLQTAYPKLHIRGLRDRTAGKKGETKGFPLLVHHPLSFRARCARKGKQHFAPAAQLLGQDKQNGCHPPEMG